MLSPHRSDCEVLTTLTPDTGRILSKLHTVQPKGKITFCTGIRVAHVSPGSLGLFLPGLRVRLQRLSFLLWTPARTRARAERGQRERSGKEVVR